MTLEASNLIFLAGLASSGKDTLGQMFVDKGFTRVAFADTLKAEYAKLKNITVEELHIQGPIKESHREGIIFYAEAKRNEDPYYWINKAIEPYLDEKGQFKEGLKLVFTDVRRISEIDWIYSFKEINYWGEQNIDTSHYIQTKLFLINRPSILDADVLSHETIGYLKGLNKVSPFTLLNATILNDSTKEDLEKKFTHLCKTYSL